MPRRRRAPLRIILCIGSMLVCCSPLLAQSTGFTLYGELRVDDSQNDVIANTVFDVILYKRVNEVFARQRVSNGKRYRFENVVTGEYNVAVEVDDVEVARLPISISENAERNIRQDLEFTWAGTRRNAGLLSASQLYHRNDKNRALYDKAMTQMNQNDLVKATKTLRSLVEADPKDFPAWKELAVLYGNQYDFAAAEKSFAKAIELKPDYVAALISLGRMRLALRNNEGAIQALEAALKADPKSATANYFLGEAYLALRKGSIAIGYMNEALKLDPIGMANAHLRLGTLYNNAGRKDLAALEYNEFLKKKPDYPEAYKLRDYIIANNPRTKPKPKPTPSPSPNP